MVIWVSLSTIILHRTLGQKKDGPSLEEKELMVSDNKQVLMESF